jgi:hypothetical protein
MGGEKNNDSNSKNMRRRIIAINRHLHDEKERDLSSRDT